jgi:hypothetical protein
MPAGVDGCSHTQALCIKVHQDADSELCVMCRPAVSVGRAVRQREMVTYKPRLGGEKENPDEASGYTVVESHKLSALKATWKDRLVMTGRT